ncbi:MAG: RNA-directed DNA polymerase [Oscillospiraceae bacterium]|nr:RNA-directed DNA polymerase [Oscillospiraceae bacterium]
MKRYKELWQKFCSYDNAILAITNGVKYKKTNRSVVRRLGDGKGGLDPDKVHEMANKLVKIIEEGWQPSPCRHISRRCKSTGKVREIDCPTLTDHFIHWMLILAIKEPMTRGMYKYSCGSIPNRGINFAKKSVERWVRSTKSKWFVKLDIVKFYPSINNDILSSLFRRVIKDERMLNEIDKVVYMIGDGLAIGTYTSQWFANFYLQSLDHFIKQELYKTRRDKRLNYVNYYLRYMDDMLLIGTSKRDLQKAIKAISAKLKENFGLEIKISWEIKDIDKYSIDIIGYRFYRTHTILRKRIFLRTKRLAKKIHKIKKNRGVINLHNAQAMMSLIGWASHCNNKKFYNKYIKPNVNLNELKGVISYESKKYNTS